MKMGLCTTEVTAQFPRGSESCSLPLVTGERLRRDARFEYCDVLLASVATSAA